MAGPELPTFSPDAELIADAIRSVQRQLLPVEGIGVASLPWDYMTALQHAITTFDSISASQLAQAATDADLAGALLLKVHPDLAAIAKALDPTLVKPLDDIEDALRGAVAPNLNAIGEWLQGISRNMDSVGENLHNIRNLLDFTLQYGLGQFKHLLDKLQTGEVKVNVTGGAGGATDLEPLLDLMKELAKTGLGIPAEGEAADFVTVGQSIANAQLAAAGAGQGAEAAQVMDEERLLERLTKVLQADSSAPVSAAGEGFAGAGGPGEGTAATTAAAWVGPLMTELMKLRDYVAPAGEATPDTVWQRCVAAWAAAASMGTIAHIISNLSQVSVFGVQVPLLKGLAGLVGQLAGFGPLGNAISGTLYDTYIRGPLAYQLHKSARPNLPSWGEYLRWVSSRKVTASGTLATGGRVPYSLHDVLAYHGLSDGWIEAHKAAMWRDLAIRDLRQIAAAAEQTDDWWFSHLRELGYKEEDIPAVRAAAESAACAGERSKLLSELYTARSRGFMSSAVYRGRVLSLGLSPRRADLLVDAADKDLDRYALEGTADVLALQYDRGQITDSEYRSGLDAVYADSRIANITYTLGRLKRYHKVWLTTPAEAVREALPTYRAACIANLITLPEYRAKLSLSGLEPDIVDLQVSLVDMEREKQQFSDFRAYGLPNLRDRVVHGLLSLSDYAVELGAHGFPPEYIGDEMALARAMLARRMESEALSQLVPVYGVAYSRGLVSALTYDAVMDEAGLPPRVRQERLDVADDERREREDKAAEQRAAEEARQRLSAERERERQRTLRQREEEKAARAVATAQAARQKQAAQAVKSIASAVRVLLQSNDPSAIDQVNGLLSRLDQAYTIAVGILPDDLYTLALAIGDALVVSGGPDLETLDGLVGVLEERLTALAG